MKEIEKVPSFPKIFPADRETSGNYAVGMLERTDVIVKEKLDGSQFAFAKRADGQVLCRSKSQQLTESNCDKQFRPAFDYVHSIAERLSPGEVYYCETFASPRQNKIRYARTPRNGLALFAVSTVNFTMEFPDIRPERVIAFFTEHDYLREFADRLDIEAVQCLGGDRPRRWTLAELNELVKSGKSQLGGTSGIEGVVISCDEPIEYVEETDDGPKTRWQPLQIAKLVRDDFKEVKVRREKRDNTSPLVEQAIEIFARYCTEARWDKAIQHLRDEGKLKGDYSDIGLIIKEIIRDVEEEEGQDIGAQLFRIFHSLFRREVIKGFPEYYKASFKRDE